MGVFTRFRDIVSANVNSMLDKAEDPEKMVKMMVREMEDALIEVKASCAGLMATKRKIQRELREVETRAADWGRKAETAVNRGREDLAREALLEKRRHTDRAKTLQKEAEQVDGMVEQSRSDINQIEEKLKVVRERERVLVQRHKRANQRRQTERTIRKVDTADIMARFETFEHRIDHMEAEADLVNYGRKNGKATTVEEELSNLERDESIEKELNELKQRNQHREPAYS